MHPTSPEPAAAAAAVLVGIDSVTIDGTTTGHRPEHTVPLTAGVVVVEQLTALGAPPSTGARFTAVPSAVPGLAALPRAGLRHPGPTRGGYQPASAKSTTGERPGRP